IPQSVVGDFADLALKVKDAGIRSVVFDDSIITPAYPDYDKIRGLVDDALHPRAPGSSTAPTSTAPTGTAPGTATGGSAAGTSASAPASPAVSAADACAYDSVAAQAALDEGEPPTKRGR
ncbi:MAG: Cell envelope-related function transcriptional attenuator common domain, partial [Blastococcus sp.]|nr:Cell envelope-related function transcriptional attenuator common domain [Blastococcus sp.]